MIGKKRKNENEELIVDLGDFENYGLVDDDEFEEDTIAPKKESKKVNEPEEIEEVEIEDDEEYEEIEDLEDYELEDGEEYEEVEEFEDIDDEEIEEDEDSFEIEDIDEEETEEEYEEEELDSDEEYEEIEEFEDIDDEEIEEDEDSFEIEDIDEEETEEEYEEEELDSDEEYEEVEEFEDIDDEEIEEDEDSFEIEDIDEEETEEEYEEEELDSDEEYEEVEEFEDIDDEEIEEDEDSFEIEDIGEEETEEEYEEEELEDGEEYEEVEDSEESLYGDDSNIMINTSDLEEIDESFELVSDEEYEEIQDELDEEEGESLETEKLIDEETENVTEEVEDSENEEVQEDVEVEDAEESEEIEEDEDDENEFETDGESIYPDELVDLELECVYLGLLFNNPKAISRFYFLYEDCHFSEKELGNLYRIILFREGEAFAPAIAKAKYQLPRENPRTYDFKYKVRKMATAKDYNLEKVYTELKKLFILKKNYLVAPTSAIQEQILDIQNYDLYSEMTVQEVESALEQITVTTGLSRAVLNQDVTSFLLSEENELSNGISLPFETLTTVFKGIRKGETMTYAMPSNSGKSRFTVDLACYIAFIHKKKVLVISNEMSQEKMKLCMITTILNNPEIQKLHKQDVRKTEGELLELKFRPDKNKKVKCDEDGYILRKKDESIEDFVKRLEKNSSEFKKTVAATEWLNTQLNNSIYFIHITEHTNDDLRKIIMNYYYKEAIEYIFYDTLKADTDNIGNGDEIKKTATILSNLAQKFKIWIGSSMQLLESSTLPVNLTINDMSASKTVKEVLDTLCLIKQISRQSLKKYEYADTDQFEKCKDIKVPKDTDVRFYACVVDKNRAGAKPTLLFRLNLAYNEWEEMGHLRLKQSEVEED